MKLSFSLLFLSGLVALAVAAPQAAPPPPAAAPPPAANAAAAAVGPGGATENNPDPAKSLTLIASVLANNPDGSATATEGQSASVISPNNFINFCAGKTVTNGKQIDGGSCNPVPMGIIAAKKNMPSCKFQFPPNLDTSITPNTPFDIKLLMKNLQTGSFTNPDVTYYAAPQAVNAQGDIIGHSHVVIQKMESLTQTTTMDPNVFAFFKGVNAKAVDGVLTVNCPGLAAGVYKMSTINAAANHQPVLVSNAQHGHLDDVVYFTVGDAKAGAAPAANAAAPAPAANAAAAAPPPAAPAATPPAAPAGAPPGAPPGAPGGQQFGRGDDNRGGDNRGPRRRRFGRDYH